MKTTHFRVSAEIEVRFANTARKVFGEIYKLDFIDDTFVKSCVNVPYDRASLKRDMVDAERGDHSSPVTNQDYFHCELILLINNENVANRLNEYMARIRDIYKEQHPDEHNITYAQASEWCNQALDVVSAGIVKEFCDAVSKYDANVFDAEHLTSQVRHQATMIRIRENAKPFNQEQEDNDE